MSTTTQDRISEDGHLQTALPGNDLQNNDVVKAVDELLDLITVKFSKISTEVFAKSKRSRPKIFQARVDKRVANIAKVDEMAQRLDELEASIKAGVDTNE